MGKLLTIEIPHPLYYLTLALSISLAVRAVISLIEWWSRGKDWFWAVFSGAGKEVESKLVGADRLTGLAIGLLEAAAYPILLRSELPLFVAAWLAFKTTDRWNYSSQDRGQFNRYLLANAMLLVYSFAMAKYWPWVAA